MRIVNADSYNIYIGDDSLSLINFKIDPSNMPLYAGPKIISNEISESLIFLS